MSGGFTRAVHGAKVSGMDVNALRTWGIAASAALIAAALAIAWRAPAPEAQGGGNAAPAEAAPVRFVVRFRGAGPIARAQAMAAAGEETRAGQAIAVQMRRQSAFAGLCFDRFTLGAAEIVLRSCEPVAPPGRAALQARRLARLKSMAALEYADINANAAAERAPR